jgi:beta-phosphoglucomutase-like phosphatase (HAD superfamily)
MAVETERARLDYGYGIGATLILVNETLAGVIFDFDGVIADSHPAHLQAWKDLFRSLGKDVSEAELSFVLEGAKREEILQRLWRRKAAVVSIAGQRDQAD